ncbi:uncharacterized protein LOC117756496 [Hippoglossus hippoglossus]|uniref:uncharacterized protein LOC117756496 n=1 Tax=Hippoglossus hippoglossus TaxID=8267 RepID=UPI00148D51EE|nr:uncharacterized protein LOC117756496 [Hippoglossus hippoglossus]
MAPTFNGKPGDLIEIFRGDYQQWAVYIRENEVVHFTTDGGQSSGSSELLSSRAEVKREKLTDVVGHDHFKVNNLLDEKYEARDPYVIVKEACVMVGCELQYNVATYNCEHFATDLRYGKAESRQFKGNKGDLIQIFRDGPYQHWAVYIGEKEVVHLVKEGGDSSGSSELLSSRAEVKREKLTDVVGNDRHQVNNLLDNMYEARDPSIIVKEACAMVGSKLQYDVATYNCEHFATKMRYGKAESWQFKGKLGDLIEIFRGPYQHWAVYIGGNEVVHFTTDGGDQSSGSLESLSSRAEVKREKLTDVVGNHRFKVNILLDKSRKAREPSVIVKEACVMVGRELSYNVATYNCEHFAVEMRYGKAESRQFKGNKGDLIEIFRDGPYQHWAVYIGGQEVVHFTTDGGDSSGSSELLSSRGEFNGKPGDLIEIFRGPYQHWAVYIGENEVVHFTTDGGGQSSGSSANPSSSTGKVKHEKITDVVGNHRYHFNGKPGDLIEIFRGPYQHWAVYIGENEVVHLVTDSGGQSFGSLESLSSRAEVKREKLTDVVGNHRFKVNILLDKSRKAREPSVIVKEACAMVGRELSYNVLTYNCEHFAIEMRYGKAESRKFKGKLGDLIQIFRGPYQHWAVYIGGQEVVHFTTDGGDQSSGSSELLSSRGEVKREKLTDVVGDDRHHINNLLDEKYKARKPMTIVKEAREMVDSELQYNVDTYNCEHFAIEMRYGKAESRQFNGKPGDLIEIFRWGHQHWAVYIGENEVVHFTTDGGDSSGSSANPSSSTGKVKREKLADVVAIPHFQVNNLLDEKYKAHDPSIIVMEACVMVGHELQYNLVTYNSKHFAIEMRYGKAESRQVKGNKGDLIEIFRGPYQHWAVYIGENEVVHLVTDSGQSFGSLESLSSRAEVKREKLTDVVGNHRFKVNILLDKSRKAREPSVIVKEACAMVGRELSYNVLTYNCEHFAIEMRYGKAESRKFKGNKGDLIEISRWGYQHWAVYIGENEVVHLVNEGGLLSCASSNPGSSNGKVLRQKFADVVSNDRYQVNNLLDEKYKAHDPSIIVMEACAMVGHELQYNLVTYNSKHFGIEMRYGEAESRQFKGKPGDLIEIFRWGYQHWAVYIGENEVVHLVNEGE